MVTGISAQAELGILPRKTAGGKRPAWWPAGPMGLMVIAVTSALLNRPGLGFEVEGGVALIYPASAAAVIGGLLFGWWGVLGSFIGMVATPWGLADTPFRAVFFAAAVSLQGAIPVVMVRRVPPWAFRSVWVLLWGAFLNTAVSASVALPGLVSWSRPPLSFRQGASAFASWFFSDMVAVMVIAVPIVLVLRPDLMLDGANRTLFKRWVRDPRSVVLAIGGVLVLVAIIELATAAGFVHVHWIAAAFLVPVMWAAIEGGVGAALLINAVAGFAYVVEVVRVQPGSGASGQFVELFSTYLNMVVFSLGAVAVGLAWGKAESMVRDLDEHRRLLQDNFERVVTALAAAVEAKDPTTEGHVQRVGRLSVSVAQRLGFEGHRLQLLRYAALLHDVGKLGIPEQILNKSGPLTAEERQILERHVTIGVEILENVDILRPTIPFIRYHQERWDGCTNGDRVRYVGYFGLQGEEIPLEARIIATVDAWDAMTHDRPYRKAMTKETAIRELRNERAKHFDPNVVDALLEIVDHPDGFDSKVSLPVFCEDLVVDEGC